MNNIASCNGGDKTSTPSSKDKVSVHNLCIRILLLFPLSTLFQAHLSFLNKLNFIFILLFLLLSIASIKSYSQKDFFLAISGLTIWGYALIRTKKDVLMHNPNMAMYYIFLILYFCHFNSKKSIFSNEFEKCKKYMYHIVLIFTGLLIISIPFPSSYMITNGGGWGNGRYFASFAGSPNRLGPAAVFVLDIIIYLLSSKYKNKNKLLLLALPNTFVFVMGGSRTYLMIGMMHFIIFLYFYFGMGRKFYLGLTFFGIVMFVAVLHSPMMTKFKTTFASGYSIDSYWFWFYLTNARIMLWEKQLGAFVKESMMVHLFGGGVNYTTIYAKNWAHNDFIEILCSYGVLGVFAYLITEFRFFRYAKVLR